MIWSTQWLHLPLSHVPAILLLTPSNPLNGTLLLFSPTIWLSDPVKEPSAAASHPTLPSPSSVTSLHIQCTSLRAVPDCPCEGSDSTYLPSMEQSNALAPVTVGLLWLSAWLSTRGGQGQDSFFPLLLLKLTTRLAEWLRVRKYL